MIFISDAERHLATAVSRLVYTNPFLPERIEAARRLVENQQLWIVQQGLRESEPLRHALRIRRHGSAARLGESHTLDQRRRLAFADFGHRLNLRNASRPRCPGGRKLP